MQHISYVLQDEYQHLIEQKQYREQEYKAQSLRKRESAEQGAETRHDNFDFEDAERQQEMIGNKIRTLTTTMQLVKIMSIDALTSPPVTVGIGSTVQLLINAKEHTYMIGGSPTIPGRVSYTSPLWKALMHAKAWETISFIHDHIEKKIQVLSVS